MEIALAAADGFRNFAGWWEWRRIQRRRRIAAKTPPMMIPIMAAVNRFFGFPTVTAGGFCGGGAGEVDGLQEGSGPPQRFRFPAKEEVGNFTNGFGIEPLSLLLETLKFVKLTAEILGIEPENPLFCKKIPVKWVRLSTAAGIVPEKLFDDKSSLVKRVKRVKLGGNSPENALS